MKATFVSINFGDPGNLDSADFHGSMNILLHGCSVLIEWDHCFFAFVLQQFYIASILLIVNALDLSQQICYHD